MVRVTESALVLLRQMKGKARSGRALRLVAKGSSGYELVLEQPQEEDQVVEQEGAALLYIAAEAAAALEGSSLVAQTTSQGPQLAVTTPQPYPFGPLSQVVALRE